MVSARYVGSFETRGKDMTDKALRYALEEARAALAGSKNCLGDIANTSHAMSLLDQQLEALSTPEPSLKGDLALRLKGELALWRAIDKAYYVDASVKRDAERINAITQAVLAALIDHGTLMGSIRDYDTREIVECRRLEDTKHLTLPPVLVLPMEDIE
jgi:hypothetical protein